MNAVLACCGMAAALWAGSGPAMAEGAPSADPACAGLIAAAGTIGTSPQYRSVLVATSPTRRRPVERELVIIGDVIYATTPGNGRWMKLPLTEANRDELSSGLVKYPPHGCTESRQDLDGIPMRVFAYRQDVSGPGSAESRLWVGEDGRPRRIESNEGTLHVVASLAYEDVKPPDFH